MKHVAVCILGNHDGAIFTGAEPDEFGPLALQAVDWTRDQLHAEHHTFLRRLPRSYREEPLLLVHGSPKDPTNEYVLPMDAHNPTKMADLFHRFDHCCLQGHTHISGVLSDSQFLRPHEIEHSYALNDDSFGDHLREGCGYRTERVRLTSWCGYAVHFVKRSI
jgi:hypothetical protein